MGGAGRVARGRPAPRHEEPREYRIGGPSVCRGTGRPGMIELGNRIRYPGPNGSTKTAEITSPYQSFWIQVSNDQNNHGGDGPERVEYTLPSKKTIAVTFDRYKVSRVEGYPEEGPALAGVTGGTGYKAQGMGLNDLRAGRKGPTN